METRPSKLQRFRSIIFKWGLPLVALLLALAAAQFILKGKPTHGLVKPVQEPAGAQQQKVSGGLVAGAGIVQPASEQVGVGSPIPAIVKSVQVKVGDEVVLGQTLFTLDDREMTAELATRHSSLELAKQNLKSAVVDSEEKLASLNLYESINDRRAMTQDELNRRKFSYQSAQSRLATSKATVAQAQAQLGQTQASLALRTIKSPLTGTVLQVKVRAGELAPATQLAEPLITIGMIHPLHVKVDIDEADIHRTNLSSPATISPKGDSTTRVQATFVRVEPLVVPKKSLTNAATERVDTRVLQVVYSLPNDVKGFFVGQQVDAFIYSQSNDEKGTEKSTSPVSKPTGKLQ